MFGTSSGKNYAEVTEAIYLGCSLADHSPHSIQLSSFSESRSKNWIMPDGTIFLCPPKQLPSYQIS
jgi:hypothetical protein